jgi:mannose-6-phosphate isomerase
MWHVLAAEPGAVIGLGLREHITRERLREAALSGEIERLINWVEAHPGDTFYVEAGTIHAIGAGLTVCEIQQNSDVTYRLYDYGRRRELHLDHGVTVASCEPYYGRVRLPLDCDFFLTEELRWTGQHTYRSAGPGEHFLIVLEGSGTMEGEAFTAGEVWSVPENAAFAVVPSEPVRVLRTKPPV